MQETDLVTEVISFESDTKSLHIGRPDLNTLKDAVFEAYSPQKLKRQKGTEIYFLEGDEAIEIEFLSPQTPIAAKALVDIYHLNVEILIKLRPLHLQLVVLYELHIYYYYKRMHFKQHTASPSRTSPQRVKIRTPIEPNRSISPQTTLPTGYSPDNKRYSQESVKAKVSSLGQ